MRSRPLGTHGPIVSEVGFGAWQIGGHGWTEVTREASLAAVQRAADLGVTLFDTADVYGLGTSEAVLADALGARRHDVTIATKFGVRVGSDGRSTRDVSPAHLERALEGSLRRLKLDVIPLYQVHWPDGVTPLDATLDALDAAVARGLIRTYGLSNFGPTEIRAAAGRRAFVAVQCRFNLIDAPRMQAVLAAARESGIGVLAHSTLAQGLLAGRHQRAGGFADGDVRRRSEYFVDGAFEANIGIAERVSMQARTAGRTPAQVAIRWVLETPGITAALCGCKNPAQVDENCDVNFPLDSLVYAWLSTSLLRHAAPSSDANP